MKKIVFFLFFSFLFATNNSLKFSYLPINFDHETMGLFESSYLFDFKNFYTGIGIYSAITGKRGGFFTGGIDIGGKYKVSDFLINGGIFLGGGGGGAAPQGGGMMSRIYLGLGYKNLGIGINKVKFLNGKIDDVNFYGFYIYDFKDLYFFKKPKIILGSVKKIIFSPYYEEYLPFKSSKTTSNEKQTKFGVIGADVIVDNYLISVGGAMEGRSDGYAEFYIGKEKKYKFLRFRAQIGASGGGKVNTKGGIGFKGSIGTNFNSFNIDTGIMLTSGFKSYFFKGYFQKKFNLITSGNRVFKKFILKKFELKISDERYMKALKKDNNFVEIDNLRMDLNYFLNSIFFVGVSASAAVTGGSGGYATGMWNFGMNYKNFFINGSIGAAGGGGVNVGSGKVIRGEIGVNYEKFFVSFGKIISSGFDSYLLNLGIRIKFYRGFL